MLKAPAWFVSATAQLRRLLARSHVPEDAGHAEDVLCWLLRLEPEAGWPLRFAALAHDVDRAMPDAMRVQRGDFANYDDFKAAHAANSARIAARLLHRAGAPTSVVHEVTRLVLHHEEQGGDSQLSLLCDADALSFYTHNLPFYLLREDENEALHRSRWGIRRLSTHGRKALRCFPFADPRIARLVTGALTEYT
ncbi:MAG: DUF4202 family protein [Mariprofundaceae bacterium]|nr:DUF4202 family protein [Mariprofundaceae bacterium]